MKKIVYILWNRITIIFGAWCALLIWCAFFSNNAYINAFALYLGLMLAVLGFAYIDESKKQTNGEKWMFNKFSQFVNVL